MMRKTFVFYTSWWDALEEFSLEMQFTVYKAIITYVKTGEVPEIEDVASRAAFNLIRTNIDMAQAEYDAKSRKRSGAAQKRWSKSKDDGTDEPQSLTSKKSTTSTTSSTTESEPEAEAAEPEESAAEPEAEAEESTAETEVAETEKDAADTEKDAAETEENAAEETTEDAAEEDKKVPEKGGDAAEPEDDAKRDLTAQQVLSEFLCHRRAEQFEGLAKELGVTRQTLETMALDVANEWRMTDMLHDSYTAGARHLVNTIRKKMSVNNNKSGKPTPGSRAGGSGTQPKLGVGEYINERGERTYGRSGVVVPPNAPPRPSNGHWWHDISEAWLLTF